MPPSETRTSTRRIEAERLIDLARGMLTEPSEEIAAIHLDHAIYALQAIAEDNVPRDRMKG